MQTKHIYVGLVGQKGVGKTTILNKLRELGASIADPGECMKVLYILHNHLHEATFLGGSYLNLKRDATTDYYFKTRFSLLFNDYWDYCLTRYENLKQDPFVNQEQLRLSLIGWAESFRVWCPSIWVSMAKERCLQESPNSSLFFGEVIHQSELEQICDIYDEIQLVYLDCSNPYNRGESEADSRDAHRLSAPLSCTIPISHINVTYDLEDSLDVAQDLYNMHIASN